MCSLGDLNLSCLNSEVSNLPCSSHHTWYCLRWYMCADISASFLCLLIFHSQTPSFCRQPRENTALCHTCITLPGLPWTLIISNKLFLHWLPQKRFPSQNSYSQKLSCQCINFIQFVWCRRETYTIPSLQCASTSETSVWSQYQRKELATGLQVTWCCKTVANTSSRAADHYFCQKGVAVIIEDPGWFTRKGKIQLSLT